MRLPPRGRCCAPCCGLDGCAPFGCRGGWVLPDDLLGCPVVVCGAVGVVTVGCVIGAAAGSPSSDDDEEVPDVEAEELRFGGAGLGLGASSASGSSRDALLAIGGMGVGCLAIEVAEDRASLGASGGGGSSICMCCALISSAAVGISPKST